MTRRRGSSTIEYAAFFCIFVAALIAMQVYLKRGMEGRFKNAIDQSNMGLQTFWGPLYSPGETFGTGVYEDSFGTSISQATMAVRTVSNEVRDLELDKEAGDKVQKSDVEMNVQQSVYMDEWQAEYEQ